MLMPQTFSGGQAAVSDAALSFTQGSLDTTDSQTAYLIGSLGAIDSQDAFVQGSTDTAASQTAWLQGSIDTTSNLDAFIQGQASTIASTDAYTVGQSSALDDKNAWLAGGIVSVDSQDAYLKGSAEAVDSINAYTEAFGGLEAYVSAYLEGDVAQDLVPDGDISGGSWKNEAEGSTLWPSIDEWPAVDADYAYYDGATGSESFEVSLSNPTFDTDREGPHQIWWRTGQLQGSATITMKVELVQTTTVIASQQKVLNSNTTYSYVLSQGEVDNITDYDDLRLRFTVVSVV